MRCGKLYFGNGDKLVESVKRTHFISHVKMTHLADSIDFPVLGANQVTTTSFRVNNKESRLFEYPNLEVLKSNVTGERIRYGFIYLIS